MFAKHLKKVVDNIDSGITTIVMGLDGIPVDQYVRQTDRLDVTTVGMEFSFILAQVRKAGESLQVGNLEELAVKTQRHEHDSHKQTPQNNKANDKQPEGNFGKARFLARMAGPAL